MNNSSNLKFPSGRTVNQVRLDAKRLKKSQKITLNEAQNKLAAENGINMPWAKAINYLQTKQTHVSFAPTSLLGNPAITYLPAFFFTEDEYKASLKASQARQEDGQLTAQMVKTLVSNKDKQFSLPELTKALGVPNNKLTHARLKRIIRELHAPYYQDILSRLKLDD